MRVLQPLHESDGTGAAGVGEDKREHLAVHILHYGGEIRRVGFVLQSCFRGAGECVCIYMCVHVYVICVGAREWLS